EDYQLNTNDDCIALKSGLNEDGWRVDKPTENVIVRRIAASGGRGGITIGSEMSGGVRNVFVHGCDCTGLGAGSRMKAARGRGGVVENVCVQDILIFFKQKTAYEMTTEYPTFAKPGGKTPDFRNIRIRNIVCDGAEVAVRMVGLPDAPFRDILLENLTIAADQ